MWCYKKMFEMKWIYIYLGTRLLMRKFSNLPKVLVRFREKRIKWSNMMKRKSQVNGPTFRNRD